jgi:hypothetical protein
VSWSRVKNLLLSLLRIHEFRLSKEHAESVELEFQALVVQSGEDRLLDLLCLCKRIHNSLKHRLEVHASLGRDGRLDRITRRDDIRHECLQPTHLNFEILWVVRARRGMGGGTTSAGVLERE